MSNVPEFKTVVVYDSNDIELVLKKLDQETPVKGVETMRSIVEVFDILKNNGSVQNAAVNHEDGEYVDPQFVDPAPIPSLVGEGDVVYDATEEPAVEEEDEPDNWDPCDEPSGIHEEEDLCENETPQTPWGGDCCDEEPSDAVEE